MKKKLYIYYDLYIDYIKIKKILTIKFNNLQRNNFIYKGIFYITYFMFCDLVIYCSLFL